jgi:N-acetylglucosaminyl-diphospho-decaprenol L-rhamnosyltransferase
VAQEKNNCFDISVVIISWRMKSMLSEMLKSIVHYTKGISYEIIIVDNNSQDGTSEMIEKEYHDAVLIKNPKNLGVAPARNQALKIAKGKYIITLDADMLFVDNSLLKLVEFMDKTSDAGLCGAKLIFPDGRVQPSGRRFPTILAFILRRLDFIAFARNSKTLRRHEMAEWDRSNIRQIDYVIGACQCIRREAMETIGFLDEKIFYGPEDIDYCLRMYKNGWNVYYYPLTSIVHFEQRITKKIIFSKLTFLHFKAVLYFFWKYKGKISYK